MLKHQSQIIGDSNLSTIATGLGILKRCPLIKSQRINRQIQNKIPERLKCVGDMNNKESSCQERSFEDFKSVYEVVRLYKLPNQKTRRSKDKVIDL